MILHPDLNSSSVGDQENVIGEKSTNKNNGETKNIVKAKEKRKSYAEAVKDGKRVRSDEQSHK